MNTARTVLPLRFVRRALHRLVVVPLWLWPHAVLLRWSVNGVEEYIRHCMRDGLDKSLSLLHYYHQADQYRCRLALIEARMRDEF